MQPWQTEPASGQASGGQSYPAYSAQSYPAQSYAASTYSGTTAYAEMPATPDGVPLAGWWQRVGAYLIDGLILAVVVSVLAFPFIRDVLSALRDFIDIASTAAQNGSPAPSTTQMQSAISSAAVKIGLIGLTVNFVYAVTFLMWKQATPGKLALGLRVRLREQPGLPLSAVLLRWGTQSALPGLIGLVPVVGTLGSVFTLVDSLWPLWDPRRQALHDKVAKTNVIRTR